MILPEQLQEGIDRELAPFHLQQLSQAASQLTERYRSPESMKGPLISSGLQRAVYLAVRMPATFAAVSAVFQQVNALAPHLSITSLLDVGAGPGTAMWAAAEVFPDLNTVTLLEQDPQLIDIGKRLASCSAHPAIQSAQWKLHDIRQSPIVEPHDLIVFSYSIGELNVEAPSTLNSYWPLANHAISIIEPGTPRGFQFIRLLRAQLLEMNAHLIAPCPHACSCPIQEGDWCHFSQRLQRTQQHRRIKEGALGFEDEKFSYVVGAKSPGIPYQSRILRHPLQHSGHVDLTLCTPTAVTKEIVSRKHKDDYRKARKAEWGDIWK